MTNPLDMRAIREAAHWYATLLPGEPDAAIRREWERWLAAEASHAQAWRRVEALRGRLQELPAPVAGAVLGREPVRRSTLRALLVLGLGTPTAVALLRTAAEPAHGAVLRTARAQRSEQRLADGTLLALDAGSRVRVAYDAAMRRLVLDAGAILVETRPDARGFVVETPQGSVRALGTRFTVRLGPGGVTQVAVLEHAVLATPARGAAPTRLQAGEQVAFSERAAGPVRPGAQAAAVWREGRARVLDTPLCELLETLAAYHPGRLGCDAAVARMRVSGVFPLDDTDEALATLAATFPVRVERLTRYWTRVVPR